MSFLWKSGEPYWLLARNLLEAVILVCYDQENHPKSVAAKTKNIYDLKFAKSCHTLDQT